MCPHSEFCDAEHVPSTTPVSSKPVSSTIIQKSEAATNVMIAVFV